MTLEGKRIGFAMTGSFCTLKAAMGALREVVARGAEVIPIFSPIVASSDTRFYRAEDLWREVTAICGRAPITTVVEAEPIGPRHLLDAVVIAPCTGNTAAKMAAGIVDTSVLMAAKAHQRNGGPVVVAIATNDGLSNNARALGQLAALRQVYLVPYGQDDAEGKPTSLVAKMDRVADTLELALDGVQIQPLLRDGT